MGAGAAAQMASSSPVSTKRMAEKITREMVFIQYAPKHEMECAGRGQASAVFGTVLEWPGQAHVRHSVTCHMRTEAVTLFYGKAMNKYTINFRKLKEKPPLLVDNPG